MEAKNIDFNEKGDIFCKFLQDDAKNIQLYLKWTQTRDEQLLTKLNILFKDFLFKVFLYSYIYKSLKLKARAFHIKQKGISEHEDLSLNVKYSEIDEEMINDIPDESINLDEELFDNSEEFWETISDPRLLKSYNALTEKQKLVLYKCIILNQSENSVAKELGISVQAVNKTKNSALDRMRKEMR